MAAFGMWDLERGVGGRTQLLGIHILLETPCERETYARRTIRYNCRHLGCQSDDDWTNAIGGPSSLAKHQLFRRRALRRTAITHWGIRNRPKSPPKDLNSLDPDRVTAADSTLSDIPEIPRPNRPNSTAFAIMALNVYLNSESSLSPARPSVYYLSFNVLPSIYTL